MWGKNYREAIRRFVRPRCTKIEMEVFGVDPECLQNFCLCGLVLSLLPLKSASNFKK